MRRRRRLRRMCFQVQNQRFHHILKIIKTNPDPVLLFEVFALLEYWNPSTIKFDKAEIALCSSSISQIVNFQRGKKR